MTKPRSKRINIKTILAHPNLAKELKEGAIDFICKIEGIRPTQNTMFDEQQQREYAEEAYLIDGWQDDRRY